ncbi:MAG: arsenosugar biosynthesis radical SAM protein ArsS [Candidatus Thorarchaeota archaeon]|nr:MAG: arsenosugar biosynthesis radical SAM protein ArsS [Candidatus Thorarchaeota archaeon]
MNTFSERMLRETGSKLTGLTHKTLQVNVGNRCNNFCNHCHLQSTPESTDIMDWELMADVLGVAEEINPKLVDITGGAPELNPRLPRFLQSLVKRDYEVQVRTNLTVLLDSRVEGLMELYRNLQIRLVASLPCYLEEDVDRQRGKSVFKKSIQVLKRLNALGYGVNPELELDLVFNPEGVFLPPNQSELERTYKEILSREWEVYFNRLLTITNMPIGRFKHMLETEQQTEQYRQLLEDSFNPHTLEKLMCRHQVCVGWDGLIYDCDFNFALRLPVATTPQHVHQFDPAAHRTREVVTGNHCFGCTAGYGSSCEGALE